MTRRTQRLNVLFREELASLMRRELRDPLVTPHHCWVPLQPAFSQALVDRPRVPLHAGIRQ